MSAPSVQSIRRRVGDTSFERGERYAREGRIRDARIQGETLKARCCGSGDSDYRVEARLEGTKIVSGSCSCPVGDGGHCKHVAALLLTFREQPGDFAAALDIDRLLQQRSKGELIDMIRSLLEAEPDLEELIESAAGAVSGGDVSRAAVQRAIDVALAREGFGDDDDRRVATALKLQLRAAAQRLEARDYANAAAVAEGILASITSQYDSISDERGDVARAALQAAATLTKCFAATPDDDPHRSEMLRSMFELLRFDVHLGGIGVSEAIPETFARTTTADERQQLVAWMRESAGEESTEGFSNNWRRECWGAMIGDLAGSEMSVDEYLAHCREFGLTEALIAELLKRKRHAEARKAAMEVAEYRLPAIADLFVRHRRTADAEAIMTERAEGKQRCEASEWLVHYFESRDRWDDAIAWRKLWFQSQPGLEPYRELRRVAKKARRWPELRDELLEIIRGTGEPAIEVPVLLEEKRSDELLQLLDAWTQAQRRIPRSTLLQLAQALEQKHPERALEIYLQQAELAIQWRQRGSYTEACELLRKARDIYQATGRDAEWRSCVEGIAAENRRLRALQDELRRARLMPR